MQRRLTKQKELVLHYVQSVRTHPTAEDVFNNTKKKLPSLTLATVYRNLHLLAEEGKIQCFMIKNEYHFDGFTDHHHHLVCTECGCIQDVVNPRLTQFVSHQLTAQKFHPTTVQVEGLCGKCC